MKRLWFAAALAATLVIGVSVGATAAGTRRNIAVNYTGITMKVDGTTVKTDASQPFIVVDEGRSYVPARYLAEAMGGKVEWDQATQTVLIATPRYVTAATSGGTTTYSFPYYGASMALPSSGVRRTGTSDQLDVALSDGLMQVLRVGLPAGTNLDTMSKAMLAGMQSTVQLSVNSETAVTVPGAVAAKDVKATAQVNGTSLPMRLRFIQDRANNVWALICTASPSAQVDDARAQVLLNGFTLPAN